MKRFLLLTALTFALVVTGCGDSKPKAIPAGGKITLKGGEVRFPEGAFVAFHPLDPALVKGLGTKPFATVDKDGNYELTSYAEKDGAPVGDYGVTVEWRAKPAKNLLGEGSGGIAIPDFFGGRYGDPQNPVLKAKVEAGGKNRFDFDLTVPE